MIEEATTCDIEQIRSWQVWPSQLENDPFAHVLVLKVHQELIGFVHYLHIYERMEISFLWIQESMRRKGYASQLLQQVIVLAQENHCENITLEVREGNTMALSLYQKFNFRLMGRRFHYYGREDALLLLREVANERCDFTCD